MTREDWIERMTFKQKNMQGFNERMHILINAIFDDVEQKIKHLDNELTYELQNNRELAFELSKMTKDRDYWKLSFNKQVEASR